MSLTVLVTGGAGYIGSHCVKQLLSRGHEVVVYDNLSTGHEGMVLTDNFVSADLSDRETLREVFNRYDIDSVMHFAAHCQVAESVDQPGKYYRNNVVNGLKLLQEMKRAGITTMVFSSSAAVYGDPDLIPIPEDVRKDPKNPYGRTKWFFEQILDDYTQAYDLSAVSLRYFNAAGSDPEGQIGEIHDPETHLIPIVLEAALGKRSHVEIFGTDYPTEDGTCIRDFIHVNDLARAHILALEELDHLEGHEPFNLGTGSGYSVREVIDTCKEVTGRDFKVISGDRRPGDPPQLIADPSKAVHQLGWDTQMSELDQIVSTAWRWMRQRD